MYRVKTFGAVQFQFGAHYSGNILILKKKSAVNPVFDFYAGNNLYCSFFVFAY